MPGKRQATGNDPLGVALCVSTAACFAAMAIFAKLAYAAGANVSTLLAPRFALAAAVLWLLVLRRGAARGLARRDAVAALALGLVLYAGETELMFQALHRIDVSLMELLIFTYPALVVVGAIALGRERASGRRLAALALASVGVTLVLAGGGTEAGDPTGVLFSLGAAALFATYVLFADRLAVRIHPLAFGALVCSGNAISFSVGGAATGSLHAMPAAAWGWTLVMTIVSTVVPIAAFLAGVARLGPSRASILAMLEPPFALLGAYLVFGDRLGPVQLGGGALVLAAVLLLQMRPVRSRARGASAETSADPAARALSRDASERDGVGVRAEVGRLPRTRVRRRDPAAAPVARR